MTNQDQQQQIVQRVPDGAAMVYADYVTVNWHPAGVKIQFSVVDVVQPRQEEVRVTAQAQVALSHEQAKALFEILGQQIAQGQGRKSRLVVPN